MTDKIKFTAPRYDDVYQEAITAMDAEYHEEPTLEDLQAECTQDREFEAREQAMADAELQLQNNYAPPEAPTKTLEQLRAEYDAAGMRSLTFDAALEPEYEALKEAIEKLQAKFNTDHRDAIMESARLGALANTAEADLRAAILAEYDAKVKLDPKTPKTLGHGCSVRVTEKLQYEDIAAVTWAETNAPYMIKRSVDEKAFKAAMESMDKLPAFVVRKETVTAVVKG